jgi:hypothetical protein
LPAKRGFPAVVGASPGALHLATAFPRPVWLDHLLPSLEPYEVVTLRATCKAVRAIVADMRAELGERPVKHLKAMLTCFPKAKTIDLTADSMTEAEQDSLIAWLKERGHSLTRVQSDTYVEPFHRRAWRAGAFKTVKSVGLYLNQAEDRALIINGIVSGVESILVGLTHEAGEVERAALGALRTFPVLKQMTCILLSEDDFDLPPFIPPSLEDLTTDVDFARPVLLLGCLLPMIEASGARLRILRLRLEGLEGPAVARGVRSLLQACASTLKVVEVDVDDSPFESAVEVVEGLASCQHLERLKVPISTFAVVPPVAVSSSVWRTSA